MNNVLIISGHTDLATSVANKTILETLARRLPEAEIVKLDELYPDFKINVEAEQQRLLRADIIVLQYPFSGTLHLPVGALDGRDLPARILARQHGRQAERQETRFVLHDGSTRNDVRPRGGDGL